MALSRVACRACLAGDVGHLVRSLRGGEVGLLSAFPGRQIDMEDGAAAGSVFEGHAAAEPRHDLLDDAEAEAGAALLPRIGYIGPGEFLEHPGLELLRDAAAVVAHRKADGRTPLFERDQHLPSRRG